MLLLALLCYFQCYFFCYCYSKNRYSVTFSVTVTQKNVTPLLFPLLLLRKTLLRYCYSSRVQPPLSINELLENRVCDWSSHILTAPRILYSNHEGVGMIRVKKESCKCGIRLLAFHLARSRLCSNR